MWAASSFWKTSLVEYFNYDTSTYMNKLSELIVKGNDNENFAFKCFYGVSLPNHGKVSLNVDV